jgi:hypothetical protein
MSLMSYSAILEQVAPNPLEKGDALKPERQLSNEGCYVMFYSHGDWSNCPVILRTTYSNTCIKILCNFNYPICYAKNENDGMSNITLLLASA